MGAQVDPAVRTLRLEELARAVDGSVRGDPACAITGVAGLAEARPGELSFYNNVRYRKALDGTRASAVVVAEGDVERLGGRGAIVVPDPYLAFARISLIFNPRPRFEPGIDPRAVVEPGAEIDPSATVMAFAFVSRGARIGPRCVLMPGVFVGERAVLGEEALLYPGVVVREACTVGARAIFQPGAVLGGDGFGFAFDLARGEHFKIPQAGVVEIDDDVEVGANSAIDRATLGKTRIGRGTKIDNLVQIGHNATVGPLCILCGQTGIAGSAVLGTAVVLGGQVGVVNHVEIADGARLAAQSAAMGDLPESGDYAGTPAGPHKTWLKASAAYWRGDQTVRELQRLRRRVAELEAKLDAAVKR